MLNEGGESSGTDDGRGRLCIVEEGRTFQQCTIRADNVDCYCGREILNFA